MQKLVRAEYVSNPIKEKEIIEDTLQKFPKQTSREHLQQLIDEAKLDEFWINDIYQVQLRHLQKRYHGSKVIWLSIHRRDKEVCRDWRDFQEIKNQLIGEECEAIELFPAESRLADTSNQYHLWCIADKSYRFPFGWPKRCVDYSSSRHTKQRGGVEA